MQDYRVGTPEAVDISYPVAGIGSRFTAAMLDTTIGGLLLFLIILGSIGLSSLPEPGPTIGVILGFTLSFLVIWGYFVLFETLWSGQTPGKRAVKIRVIKTSGHPIGFVDAAIRNILRLVDWLPFLYTVGVLTMFINAQSRRVGDLAAGTLVVKERARVGLDDVVRLTASDTALHSRPIAPRGPSELDWNLRALTSQDLQIAADYVARAPTFDPLVRQRVGREVSALVSTRIGAPQPDDPDAFLRRVLELSTSES